MRLFLGMQIGSITTTGHSLGGALAALCAADIADCLNSAPAENAAILPDQPERLTSQRPHRLAELATPAVGSTQTVIQSTQQRVAFAVLSNQVEEIYNKTGGAVAGCRTAMEDHLERHSSAMPPVTAVTFGAPRVGDRNFAAKFGERRCLPISQGVRLQLWVVSYAEFRQAW